MKKKRSKHKEIIFLVILFSLCTVSIFCENREKNREAVYLSKEALKCEYSLNLNLDEISQDMLSPRYWIKDKEGIRLRKTASEIKEFNQKLLNNPDSHLVDLTALPDSMKADTIEQMIEKYTFGESRYLNGEIFTEKRKQEIAFQRNLECLKSKKNVALTYGVLTNEASVRSFPTNDILMDTKDDWWFDRFQETAFKLGEGVVIYHTSFDGNWLFCQGKNYNGWIESKYIARCTKKMFLNYLSNKDFYVVTRPNDYTLNGQLLHFAMGVLLMADGDDNVLLPVSQKGMLDFYPISKDNIELHRGYLPYTDALVVNQAMKLLNIPYRWGSKEYLLDCSSFILSIYECFGFLLPRNTSAMAACGSIDGIVVGGCNKRQKIEKLSSLRAGTILVFDGHVMLYLGREKEECYALHAISFTRDTKGALIQRMCVDLTPLDIWRVNGKKLLDSIEVMWEL